MSLIERAKQMATDYQNKLLTFDKLESFSELEKLEKSLTYESLFYTTRNLVLLEKYNIKMEEMMIKGVPKCDSVIKRDILVNLESLYVEDTIVSFLSFSRRYQ